MIQPSSHDRIVSLAYWPTLVTTIGIMIAPFPLVWFSMSLDMMALAIGIAVIILLGTAMVNTDAESQQAFADFRVYMRENWQDWTWTDRLTMKIGDVPFTVCNRILFLEGIFMMILQRQDMFLLLLLGFGISMFMMILHLKTDNSWR